ncbi:MAG: methylenetetrahydrofolate reductase [Kiritimatiellae bacterium]|nr:methylenetetrahydrofolate reductase [Kiritimatiellia bacterium]
MKISELLSVDRPSVSFEIFPPKRPEPSLFGGEEERLAMERTKEVVRKIAAERPSFVSVTYGAAGGTTGANTAAIAEFVQQCGVPALAHLTCISSSRERIADELKVFREKGIENILCLRGDYPPGKEDARRETKDFSHAVDLVRVLRPSTFCLGGACYPERHPECAHLEEDIAHLKEKVDAGLDFLTTQMFFDNNVYFHYLARLRTAGVTIPVLAGIMPVTNGRQIERICKLSGTTLPPRFRAIVDRFGENAQAMMDAGIAYATEQIVDLFANGVNHVHVYTMNKPEIAIRIMLNLHGLVS